LEDNSNIYIKKSTNTSKKNYIYDDNSILNKINKITNSNIYKHYSISNLQENILSNKTIIKTPIKNNETAPISVAFGYQRQHRERYVGESPVWIVPPVKTCNRDSGLKAKKGYAVSRHLYECECDV
jgi:hypothetical protein